MTVEQVDGVGLLHLVFSMPQPSPEGEPFEASGFGCLWAASGCSQGRPMAVVGSRRSRYLECHFGCRGDFGGWPRLPQTRGKTKGFHTRCTESEDETKDVGLAPGIWALRVFVI